MSVHPNMAQVEFYVSREEKTLGPWSIDEVAAHLASAEIAVTDFIYDELRADWIPLMDCTALKDKLNAVKPKAPPPPKPQLKIANPVDPVPSTEPVAAPLEPKSTAAARDNETLDRAEWFVMKGEHRYGPFTYSGLVQALQEKSVYEFDFVWKNGMDEWVRIAELDAFHPLRIREFLTKLGAEELAGQGVFFRRKYPRVPFSGEVMVHDNQMVYVGQAQEGSEGGFGLLIQNATLIPGQVVMVHFASRDGLKAFNAKCEIVSKKYNKDIRDPRSPVVYGLRTMELEASVQTHVSEYIRAKAAHMGAAS